MRWLAPFLLAGVVLAADLEPDRGALDLMPGLEQPARNQVYRALAVSEREFRNVAKKTREVEAALKKDPKPEERKRLQAERARLRRLPAELRARYEKRLKEAGLDDAQIARLKRMASGRLRHERYNRGVVLEAPELTGRQRALLGPLLAAADAAQLALAAQRDRLKSDLQDAEPIVRRQVESSINQRIRDIDRRFWRIAYYALDAGQMRAVRMLFSPRLRPVPQLREQMMLVPGLTPSQASLVTALFTEHESETAADQAEARRCRADLGRKTLAKEERQALQERLRAAYARLGSLRESFVQALREALTQEQKDALNSAPPYLNLGERGQPPWQIVRGMRPSQAQADAIRALAQELNRERKRLQEEGQEGYGDMMGTFGPESPQQMTMMVMYRGIQGEVHEVIRGLGQRLVLDVLEPDQVRNWITAG